MVDWALLPPDLLQSIASHLPNLSDHIRFRVVCSSFRTAAKSLPSLPLGSTSLLPPPSSPSSSPNPTPSLPSSLPEKPPDCSPSPTAGSPSSGLRSISLSLPFSRSSLPPSSTPPPPLHPPLPRLLRFTKFIHKGAPFVAALCPDGPDIFFCDAAANVVNPVWRSIDTLFCFPQEDFA